MNNTAKIVHLKGSEIEAGKWNSCIMEAENGRFYANDWHLDRVTDNWEALVYGDYEYVMPLPLREKWGIKYVFQPLYCQQLGIFPNPPKEIANRFFELLRDKYLYVDTHLNAGNPDSELSGFTVLPRINYLLNLGAEYETLAKSYSKNTKRNIAKAANNNLKMVAGISLEDYLAFKSENLPEKIRKNDIASLKNIIAFGQYKGFGKIYGVYSEDNSLCAAVYFCRWKNRVIYLNAATSESGKERGAMYFLVDGFIRENAGLQVTLDFEGSMIEGVARFYAGFGATAETYSQLKLNRLPLGLKWIKR